MALRETFLYADQYIGEGATWFYTTILKDKLGAAIPSSQLSTVTLTLLDVTVSPHEIVNACDAANIKNARSCTVDSAGTLKVTSIAGDTALLHSGNTLEMRRARIEWTKTGNTETFWREIDIVIRAKTPHEP